MVTEPARYVVPFIGSGGFGFRHGSAFPGASAPHGLCKVGPDTKGPWGTVGFLHFSGYWYGDDTVQDSPICICTAPVPPITECSQ